MAPEGQPCATAAIVSTAALSGRIQGPSALATNTPGRESTQVREWMHLLPSKRTTIFSPRYSSVLLLIAAVLRMS
jgi:hypothetical protein